MQIPTSRCKLALGATIAGLTVLAVGLNQRGVLAQKPVSKTGEAAATAPSDYSRRPVAYIFNTIPITREELGEDLIARFGAERLPNLVNKRIIEHIGRQKGIEITAAEVEAALENDLKKMAVSRKEFVDQILRRRQKTLYEWKEDVIKPGLIMSRLCQDRVQVTEAEIKMGFEAYYGEKIECRMILWPKDELQIATRMYEQIRKSEEAFDKAAREQADQRLASAGGRVPPFGRHTTGNPDLERTAFGLQPGEMSEILGTPEGHVVLKCIKRLPPDTSKKLEDERAKIEKEVREKKIQLEIKNLFAEMREQAKPVQVLKEYTSGEELLRDVRQELQSGAKTATPPRGN
jgi:hypothetical protein